MVCGSAGEIQGTNNIRGEILVVVADHLLPVNGEATVMLGGHRGLPHEDGVDEGDQATQQHTHILDDRPRGEG